MRFSKNIGLEYLFYLSFIIVMVIAIFFDKKLLVFALPFTIICVGLLYLNSTIKVNYWYLLSLFLMLITDILIYMDFKSYFSIICALIGVFFLLSSLVLKKFVVLDKFHRGTLVSLPFLIGTALIIYLIYAISELLLPHVLKALPFVIISLVGSVTFTITSYLVYHAVKYKDKVKIMIVAGLCIFIVALVPINELFYYNRVFTILINLTHVLSLYVFMKFLIDAKHQTNVSETKKYL